MAKPRPVSIEECLRLHFIVDETHRQKALRAWHIALTGKSEPRNDEPLLTLKELAKTLNYSCSHLWRLGVQDVSEGFGGRPRYRLRKVQDYLRSSGCMGRRETMRKERRKARLEAE